MLVRLLQAVANICWSLARLDLFPPAHVTSTLADGAAAQCGAFSDQGLANVLWGLAKLRANLRQPWWNTVLKVGLHVHVMVWSRRHARSVQ